MNEMRCKPEISLEFSEYTTINMFLQIMRLRRIERGALTLASAEVKFQIDTETHDPLDIGKMF